MPSSGKSATAACISEARRARPSVRSTLYAGSATRTNGMHTAARMKPCE